jgi:hypothetical protein
MEKAERGGGVGGGAQVPCPLTPTLAGRDTHRPSCLKRRGESDEEGGSGRGEGEGE